MIAHKKVVAPKIVQENPRQRILWVVLLLAGFFIVAWFSYDYGRTRAQVSGGGDVVQAQESARRITELEQERDTLKEQLTALERDVETGRQALEVARARTLTLQEKRAVQVSLPEPEEAVVIQEAADNRLHLENMQLASTDTDNLYRYGFSVMHAGEGSDRVTGTIWIAVNGLTDGKPTRLSLQRISPDQRKFLKMSFELQQDVQGEVLLPPDFNPKNIMIEAKPYNTKYQGISATFDWLTTGSE